MKKIPFNCYVGDATAVMILLSEVDCRDRHALPVESEHTATSSTYGEGKKDETPLGTDQQNTNSNPLFSTKHLLEDEDPMQLLYEKLKKPAKQPKAESPHKIELDRTRAIVTKTAHLVKRKNDVITRFGEWTELTVENMKSLAEANQVEKSDINKLWESNLAGFGGVIYLNNAARIMEKELLKSEDCENMNILKERYETNQ